MTESIVMPFGISTDEAQKLLERVNAIMSALLANGTFTVDARKCELVVRLELNGLGSGGFGVPWDYLRAVSDMPALIQHQLESVVIKICLEKYIKRDGNGYQPTAN